MSIEEEMQEYEKLTCLIRETLQHDAELRGKYDVAEKFRFVKEKLLALLVHLEDEIKALQIAEHEQNTQKENSADTVLVYVYLYNAQGVVLRSWSAMFTPKVFYEYSVNRPIYSDKSAIDTMMRAKPNRQQHGYLAIKVKQSDIISKSEAILKDPIGNLLLRVREGSLKFENMQSFTHNDVVYRLNAQGELVKID